MEIEFRNFDQTNCLYCFRGAELYWNIYISKARLMLSKTDKIKFKQWFEVKKTSKP